MGFKKTPTDSAIYSLRAAGSGRAYLEEKERMVHVAVEDPTLKSKNRE
jgi:hypothetical protein